MGHTSGPVGFALTRQKLPVLDASLVQGASRGGYALAMENGALKLILIGTGSEVHLCLAARDLLHKADIPTRVVSLPCWQIFDAQDRVYRDEVLPPAVTARVAVEAASPFGWDRYVGSLGKVVGINRFGASAPGPVNMEKFGFTPDNVARVAMAVLGRTYP